MRLAWVLLMVTVCATAVAGQPSCPTDSGGCSNACSNAGYQGSSWSSSYSSSSGSSSSCRCLGSTGSFVALSCQRAPAATPTYSNPPAPTYSPRYSTPSSSPTYYAPTPPTMYSGPTYAAITGGWTRTSVSPSQCALPGDSAYACSSSYTIGSSGIQGGSFQLSFRSGYSQTCSLGAGALPANGNTANVAFQDGSYATVYFSSDNCQATVVAVVYGVTCTGTYARDSCSSANKVTSGAEASYKLGRAVAAAAAAAATVGFMV